MGLKIYCFSLYCEGNGLVKSYPFVTIRKSPEEATSKAQEVNLTTFPVAGGWHNHQISMIEVSEDTIAKIAKENIE